MRLRPSSTEACSHRAGVRRGGLVESADRSAETGLRHVAEATGLVPIYRKILVVEDYFAKQCDLLKAVQRCRLRLVERFILDAIDLQFDRLDFLQRCAWNRIPISWAVCFPGAKCRCSRDQSDRSGACHPGVMSFQGVLLAEGVAGYASPRATLSKIHRIC